MYNPSSKNYNFNNEDNNNTNNSSNKIYVSSTNTNKNIIEEHLSTLGKLPKNQSNYVETYSLDDVVSKDFNAKKLDSRFKSENQYKQENLRKIISNEYLRNQYGEKTKPAYNSEEKLIEDLKKLESIYQQFDGFEYFNQVLYEEKYASSTIEEGGCCPTCLAMVLSYLTKNEVLPTDLTDPMSNYFFYGLGTDVTGNCYPDICRKYDIKPTRLDWWNKNEVQTALENKKPIILNVVQGDFTNSGHYIVLLGLDDKGDVIVADPNSVHNSTKTYSLDSLLNQTHNIEAACWSFE